MTEGMHILYMWVQDNYGKSAEISIPFKVDKSAPALGTVTATSSINSIIITGSATDSIAGLHASPYRYTVGANVTAWLTSTSYTQNSLTPNTSYGVTFEARDTVGHTGTWSQTIYTKAQVPTLMVGAPTSSTLELTVTDGNPAGTQYQIKTGSYYAAQTGALTTTPTWITLNANKKITISGLSANTAYTFTALAKNGAGTVTVASDPAIGITLVAPPATPTNLTYTASPNSITVSWPAVTGATSYSISIDNGATVINNYPGTSYAHTGLAPGVQHTYKVQAQNQGGSSGWSSLLTAATLLNTPSNITATATGTSLTLSWDPVANATSYDAKVDGITKNTTETTIPFGGLNANTPHTYSVRAKNSVSASEWSGDQNRSTRKDVPDVPENLSTAATNSSITLTWDPAAGATTYQVNVDGSIINSGSHTSYVDAGLTPGSAHTYLVRAVNSGGKSGWSVPVTASATPLESGVPANLNALTTSDAVTVTWDPVQDATGYDLHIENDGDVSMIRVAGPSYTQTGLTPGSVCTYKVRSVTGENTSAWSPSLTITVGDNPSGVPGNIETAVDHTSVSLIWDSVHGAASYEIEENGVIVNRVRAVTCVREGLTPNTQYTYRIRAVNTAGTGAWSESVTVITSTTPALPMPGNIIAALTTDSISLAWDAVGGADGYDIEIDQTTVQHVTENRYDLTGLTANTQHQIRVRGVSGDREGAWSSFLTVATLVEGQTGTSGPAGTALTVNVSQGQEIILVLTAADIQGLHNTGFTVAYDAGQLDLADLCATTPRADRDPGDIPGTDLHVTQAAPGAIAFTLRTPVSTGQSFTGLVTTIKFTSKVDGQSVITYQIN